MCFFKACKYFFNKESQHCYSLVPAKLMREWRAQFEAGIPLYEKKEVVEEAEVTAQQVLEEERQNLLDEGDFMEYKVHTSY